MSNKRTPRQWAAGRLRRFAQRLAPIRGGWDGAIFTDWEANDDLTLWVESDGTGWGTSLKVNGRPVMNCSGISFEIKSGDVARATIDLDPVPLFLKGQLRAENTREGANA